MSFKNSHPSRSGGLSRRRFLGTVSAGALVGASLPALSRADDFMCSETGLECGETTLRIRRNVYALDSNGATMSALREGIRVMQSRPVMAPTSWLFQANIHGTTDSPPNGLSSEARATWNTCRHSSYHFLSWHRMYVHFFERIVRAAAGEPDFALPYWNYAIPGQRALPPAFRNAEGGNNPLFVAARRSFDPDINGGEEIPASVSSSADAMRETFFGSPQWFGFTWQLEQQPHNIMHVVLGGSGWMSDPRMAARDPIFWLHHCNIDRLWSQWNASGGGRDNPVDDDTWMRTEFFFYDEDGVRVAMTGEEILNTVDDLDYRYDDEPGPEIGLVAEAGGGSPTEVTTEPLELAVMQEGSSITLGAGLTAVSLGVTTEAGADIFTTDPADPLAQPTLLEFGDIAYESPPALWYEVYVNRPTGAPADPRGPYFAGNLAFFAMNGMSGMAGMADRRDPALDITGLLNLQIEQGLWNGGDVAVEFVPRGNESPDTEAVPIDQQVTIGSIRIVRQ